MDKLYEELFRAMNQFRKLKFAEMFPMINRTDFFVMCTIMDKGENGKITISSAKLAPVVCHYSRGGNGFVFSVYKLSDYTDELAATQAQKGATVKYFTDLSKKVIPAEFLDI